MERYKPAVPLPTPQRKDVIEAPTGAATVVEAQGTSEDDKGWTIIKAGIPHPSWDVPSSSKPKLPGFTSVDPYYVIRNVVDSAPAGLFGSIMDDLKKVSCAEIDNDFLTALQTEDQNKRCANPSEAIDHPLVVPVWNELETYQAGKYTPKGVSYFKAMERGEQESEIVVRTYAELLDGGNSRTGSWSGSWRVMQNSSSEAQMSGDIGVKVWGYEESNVHMNCKHSFAPLTVHAESELPKKIVGQIAAWEDEVLRCLKTVYEEDMDSTLKAIRRTLPITRTRLKWDFIAERSVKTHFKKKK
jgi:hypothetical protein